MISAILSATTAMVFAMALWPKLPSGPNDSLVELFDEGVAVVTQSYDTTWGGETQLQIGSSV